MDIASAHAAYMELLMDKVREDRYPSGELMDRIEAGMASREQAEEYLEVLMEKAGESRYPSKQMLDRIERLAPPIRAR
jgi:hypothetical protein